MEGSVMALDKDGSFQKGSENRKSNGTSNIAGFL